MNFAKLLERYEKAPVSSERTFPATPFPRKHVHCVIESLDDAVKAVFTLRVAGFDAEDIHFMACSYENLGKGVGKAKGARKQPRAGCAGNRGFSFMNQID
jgi:hypothetical protein